jgi:hypothetical protein
MQITFHTKNINSKIYEKCILQYIYQHYYYLDYPRYMKQDKWKIEIMPVSMADISFYSNDEKKSLSPQIPHGVTGMNTVKCYILDIDNNMIMLQNFSAIFHELAHMILKIYYPVRASHQRHDDFYSLKGNKKKFFSSEIHDRATEGKFRQIKVITGFRKSITLICLDITDLTNSRKEKRL